MWQSVPLLRTAALPSLCTVLQWSHLLTALHAAQPHEVWYACFTGVTLCIICLLAMGFSGPMH